MFVKKKNKLQKTSSQSKKMLSKNRPSLIRQAINILMHYPGLVLEISEDKEFNHIDDKGIDTLREIINLIDPQFGESALY